MWGTVKGSDGPWRQWPDNIECHTACTSSSERTLCSCPMVLSPTQPSMSTPALLWSWCCPVSQKQSMCLHMNSRHKPRCTTQKGNNTNPNMSDCTCATRITPKGEVCNWQHWTEMYKIMMVFQTGVQNTPPSQIPAKLTVLPQTHPICWSRYWLLSHSNKQSNVWKVSLGIQHRKLFVARHLTFFMKSGLYCSSSWPGPFRQEETCPRSFCLLLFHFKMVKN